MIRSVVPDVTILGDSGRLFDAPIRVLMPGLPMELLSLNCQHCSAPLQVPAEAKFVTCTHCGSQLAIRQTGSVAYTETLDAIDERTERMAEQLDDLHRRTAVADLDRQWESERQRFYVEGREGRRTLPTKTGSIAGGLIVAAFGTLWTIVACGIGGGAFAGRGGMFGVIGFLFPLFGTVFIAVGLWNAYQSYHKAEAYERANAHYRRERERLSIDPPSQ